MLLGVQTANADIWILIQESTKYILMSFQVKTDGVNMFSGAEDVVCVQAQLYCIWKVNLNIQ